MDDVYGVADKTTMTPAERALCVEQAETARLHLERFVDLCREGSTPDAIRAYLPAHQAMDYTQNILNEALRRTMQVMHGEGGM